MDTQIRKRKPKDVAKRTSGQPFFVRFTPAFESRVRAEADRHGLPVSAYLRLVVVKFFNDRKNNEIVLSEPAPSSGIDLE